MNPPATPRIPWLKGMPQCVKCKVKSSQNGRKQEKQMKLSCWLVSGHQEWQIAKKFFKYIWRWRHCVRAWLTTITMLTQYLEVRSHCWSQRWAFKRFQKKCLQSVVLWISVETQWRVFAMIIERFSIVFHLANEAVDIFRNNISESYLPKV